MTTAADTHSNFKLKLFVLNGIKDKIITCGCISNSLLWLGFSDGSYSCLQTDNADLKFTKLSGGSIRSIHTDSSGFHSIIGMSSGQIYYAHFGVDQTILLKDLSNDCNILIGTQQGSIIYGTLSKEKLIKKSLEKFKICIDLPGSEPVLGVVTIPIIYNDTINLGVVAACTRKLYEFFGGNSILDTFSKCFSDRASMSDYLRYQVPLASPRGELFLSESNGNRFLFWMNGSCVVMTRVMQKLQPNHTRKSFLQWPPVIFSYTILNPTSQLLLSQSVFFQVPSKIPRLFTATSNNIYLILDDTLVVSSILTKRIIYSYQFPNDIYGEIRNLIIDPLDKTLWVVTSTLIYRVLFRDDSEGMWKLYLDNNDYINALSASTTDLQKSIVIDSHAKYLFAKGEYLNAANLFSTSYCTIPFHKVYLMLVEADQKEALLLYLTKILSTLRPEASCAIYDGKPTLPIQQHVRGLIHPRESILVICILHLYLEILDDLEHVSAPESQFAPYLNKFFMLLKCYRSVDEIQNPIYKLFHSFGAENYLAKYSLMRRDVLTYVSQNISSGNYSNAIKFLGMNPLDFLVNQFAPILFLHEPNEFADRINELSNPDSIFTSLVIGLYLKGMHLDMAIKLARKFTISQNHQSHIIWNLFILLQCYSNDEIEFGEPKNIDFTLALQCMRKLGNIKAVTGLLSLMGHHREAFDEAIEVKDFELAMTCASRPSDLALKRQLWLRLVEEMNKNGKEIDFEFLLKQSQVLSLEDLLNRVQSNISGVLPLFSSTVSKITGEINAYKSEIATCCDIIQKLQPSKANSQEYIDVGPSNVCLFCGTVAIVEKFFVFNCKHVFHVSCVCKFIFKFLDNLAVSELERLLAKPKTPDVVSKIIDIIASECLFCGNFMIKSINIPLDG